MFRALTWFCPRCVGPVPVTGTLDVASHGKFTQHWMTVRLHAIRTMFAASVTTSGKVGRPRQADQPSGVSARPNAYSRFTTLGSTTVLSGNRTTKNIWRNGPFTASEKQTNRLCPKLLRFECADLYVVKSRHKVGGDFGRLLFGYSVGGILFSNLKSVFKRPTILSRASVSKQLNLRTLEWPVRGRSGSWQGSEWWVMSARSSYPKTVASMVVSADSRKESGPTF
jgi:hypothetical protein